MVVLLKADPLFNQHLLENMLFLVHALSLAITHSQLLVRPYGTHYLVMFAALSYRDCLLF
jgi:hypothetical protein